MQDELFQTEDDVYLSRSNSSERIDTPPFSPITSSDTVQESSGSVSSTPSVVHTLQLPLEDSTLLDSLNTCTPSVASDIQTSSVPPHVCTLSVPPDVSSAPSEPSDVHTPVVPLSLSQPAHFP